MRWALLAIATIAAVELFLRLDIAGRARQLLAVVRKVLRVMQSSAISDHWKERALLAYAGRMFTGSVTLLALLLLAVTPFSIAAWIDAESLDLLMQFTGMTACLIVAGLYVPLRRRLRHV